MSDAQVSQPTIIIFALFLLFVIVLAKLFLFPLIVVIVNFTILYFVVLRSYTDITNYKRGELFTLCALAAFFILVIIKNFLPLWNITTLGIMSLVFLHGYLALSRP